MKNVVHTHIHATQAQYPKPALKKLRLASLAVATLSLVGSIANAATTKSPTVKTILQIGSPSCQVSHAGSGGVIPLHGSDIVATETTTFNEWISAANSSITSAKIGSGWKSSSTWEIPAIIECGKANQTILSIYIQPGPAAVVVPGTPGEQRLADSGSQNYAFGNSGRLSAELVSIDNGQILQVSHGFNGALPPYAIPFTTGALQANSKSIARVIWRPIVMADGAATIGQHSGSEFSGEFEFVVNY